MPPSQWPQLDVKSVKFTKEECVRISYAPTEVGKLWQLPFHPLTQCALLIFLPWLWWVCWKCVLDVVRMLGNLNVLALIEREVCETRKTFYMGSISNGSFDDISSDKESTHLLTVCNQLEPSGWTPHSKRTWNPTPKQHHSRLYIEQSPFCVAWERGHLPLPPFVTLLDASRTSLEHSSWEAYAVYPRQPRRSASELSTGTRVDLDGKVEDECWERGGVLSKEWEPWPKKTQSLASVSVNSLRRNTTKRVLFVFWNEMSKWKDWASLDICIFSPGWLDVSVWRCFPSPENGLLYMIRDSCNVKATGIPVDVKRTGQAKASPVVAPRSSLLEDTRQFLCEGFISALEMASLVPPSTMFWSRDRWTPQEVFSKSVWA